MFEVLSTGLREGWMPDELGRRSHRLFGRHYRLALWAAIATRSVRDEFTNSELASEIGATTGEISKELTVLVDLGLVVEGTRSGTKPFRRVDSAFWTGCAGLHAEWTRGAGKRPRVVRLH